MRERERVRESMRERERFREEERERGACLPKVNHI
jgi:hypothetical protein